MKKFIYSLFVLACAVMAFSSCEDVPAPYNMPQEVIDEIAEPSGSGTAEDPYNAAAANQLGESLEADANSETVYIKGIVTRFDRDGVNPEYGNATFYISEDGTTNNEFYVFHCYGLGGERFTSEDELKVGDEVIVCGQITNFMGNTVELDQGGYIYSLNGTVVPKDDQSTAEPEGEGTLESPYNVAKAQEVIANGAPDEEVYVKGKVSEIRGLNTQYGSLTYYISDDGTTTGQLYVYGGLYLNGEKFSSEDQLKVGDEVVIRGKLVLYGSTPEINTNSVLISINGQGGTVAGDGTEANPYSASQALELIKAEQFESGTKYYVKGIISKVEKFDDRYSSITYYISDDGSSTNELQIYSGKSFNGEGFSSINDLKVGDEVVILGEFKLFNGTPEVDKSSEIISLNGQTGEGGSTGGSGVTISGNTVTLTNSAVTAGSETATFVVADQGFTNAQKMSTVTMSDGSVITFDNNGEQNGSAYYDSGKSIRVYKNNIMHFSCKKPIAKIVITCRNESYTGNKTATFTINGKEAEYNNVFTEEKGGGIQMHFTNIVVTYAK